MNHPTNPLSRRLFLGAAGIGLGAALKPAAVRAAGWTGPYFVDADHVNRSTVDRSIEACDFFTIDVAAFIGKSGIWDPSGLVLASAGASAETIVAARELYASAAYEDALDNITFDTPEQGSLGFDDYVISYMLDIDVSKKQMLLAK